MTRNTDQMIAVAKSRRGFLYGGVLFVGFIAYMVVCIYIQGNYMSLSQEKDELELRYRELYGLLLNAELKINKLSSIERMSLVADSLGLSYREPFLKVYLTNETGGRK